jgi:hypothetical protein
MCGLGQLPGCLPCLRSGDVKHLNGSNGSVGLYLKGAVLEVLLDIRREVLVLLHALLHRDLALDLCDQLFID